MVDYLYKVILKRKKRSVIEGISLILLFIFCSLSRCKEKNLHSITVTGRRVLPDIPSVSGMEFVNGNFFIISDNTPWLYQLNDRYEILDTIQIAPTGNLKGNIFEKQAKPDFEGMALVAVEGKKELFIFGSGSKSPERNLLVCVAIENNNMVRAYCLDTFYQKILSDTKLKREALNIEGIAVKDKYLYLFNRGNNAIWEYELEDFLAYLEGKKTWTEPHVYSILLPKYKNIQAGFSGATAISGEPKIIFTASVENTANWMDDGEVLGSYIGIVDLTQLKDQYQPICIPILKEDKMLKIKAESVCILPEKEQRALCLVMATDSDGGASEIIKARLNF